MYINALQSPKVSNPETDTHLSRKVTKNPRHIPIPDPRKIPATLLFTLFNLPRKLI